MTFPRATPLFAVVTVLLWAAPATRAEEPPWRARWIGPVLPDMVRLEGCSWIWHAEAGADARRNAPSGARFFRRALEVSGRVRSATVVMAADNAFTLFVNGREAGRGADWQTPGRFDIAPLLVRGRNVLAVEAVNGTGGAINAAGLIGRIVVETEGGGARALGTDGSWRSSAVRAERWQAADFDDAPWQPVVTLGAAGSAPWQGVAISGAPANLWTCYRKTFTLAAKPAAPVPARIAVDSRYWLWVNGRPVVFEGGLKRGPTPEDTYYDTVDLAPHLVRGPNTIAVLAWYWGKDGFSHKSSGAPGLLFECRAGGTILRSDRSWKAKMHPAYGTAQGPQPNFRLSEHPVRFDARAGLGDWTAPGFRDADWQAPVERGAPPAAPWNRLYPRPIPLWKDFGLRPYTNAAELPARSTGRPVVARLPYNAQVTPWLKIDAPAGLVIEMRTDNALNEIYTQYVTRAGVQEFEGLAWMNGHAVVYRMPPGVKILSLRYRETGYAADLSGAFSSDQPFYDRLWAKAQRTLYVTMRDNYMDCPDRERAQWWGDAVNELGEAFYALSPSSGALTRKAIFDLIRWQRPDKTVYSPVPAGNWDKELPAQMLASVGKYGFWTYYFHSGDKRTLAAAYPHVRDYLSVWRLDADGLVVHRPGGWDWSDWGRNIDERLLDNAWFCLALEGAADMADAVGRRNEAAAYRARRRSLAGAINKRLWNGQEYRTPGYQGATDDRGNGLVVVAGIVDPARFAAVKQVLAREFHASPYMEKYVLEALVLMGDPDAALARMKRRYDRIVAGPLTTLPEEWNGGTDNHAWSGGPLTILSQYIAGVAPLTPAYATYEVRPRMGSLKRVHTTVDSVKGKIDVRLARDGDRFRLTLTSPAATSAVVCIPVDGRKRTRVAVNGKAFWDSGKGGTSGTPRGVSFRGVDARYARFAVPPGSWRFEAR